MATLIIRYPTSDKLYRTSLTPYNTIEILQHSISKVLVLFCMSKRGENTCSLFIQNPLQNYSSEHPCLFLFPPQRLPMIMSLPKKNVSLLFQPQKKTATKKWCHSFVMNINIINNSSRDDKIYTFLNKSHQIWHRVQFFIAK